MHHTTTFNEINVLCSGTGARVTFKLFGKFESSLELETSTCIIYRIDAIITNTVGSLSSLLFESGTVHNQNPDENFDRTSHTNNRNKYKSRSIIASKGEQIPQNSAQKLKELLPVSAINFLQICLDTVSNETRMSGFYVQKESSFPMHRREDKRVRNDFRDHTIAFCMSSNGNFYTVSTMTASRQFRSGWTRVAHDFYICSQIVLT